jgi:hypothetical protein
MHGIVHFGNIEDMLGTSKIRHEIIATEMRPVLKGGVKIMSDGIVLAIHVKTLVLREPEQ